MTATEGQARTEQEVRTLRAFGKLLWVQNDLINRHYQDRFPAGAEETRRMSLTN